MRIELDEACNCGDKVLPGYTKYGGHRLCRGCDMFIITPLRRKRLKRVRKLTASSIMDDRKGSIASKAKARAERKRAKEEET